MVCEMSGNKGEGVGGRTEKLAPANNFIVDMCVCGVDGSTDWMWAGWVANRKHDS